MVGWVPELAYRRLSSSVEGRFTSRPSRAALGGCDKCAIAFSGELTRHEQGLERKAISVAALATGIPAGRVHSTGVA